MSDTPAISVIVPVHNGEDHVRDCLESILRQTLTDFELIVVDDASTDGTRAIVEGFVRQDTRVTCVGGPGSGSAGAARNVGLALARGRFLAFLDADDLFAPQLLAELYRRAVADDADVAITGFRVFDERTGDLAPADWGLRLERFPQRRPCSPGDLGDHLFLVTNPAPWNKLFRTDFIRGRGLRFQELRRTNDAYFTYMAIAEAERITHVDRYLVDYRVGNQASLQGSVQETPLDFVDALEAMRNRLVETGTFAALERAFVNKALELCLTNLKRCSSVESYLALRDALVDGIFDRLGILGRPDDFYLVPEFSRRLAAILADPAADLFGQLTQATARATKAEAEARAALRSLAMRPPGGWLSPASPPATPATPATLAGTSPTPGAAIEAARSDQLDLSVIVPVYNTDAFLAECLASVQSQTGVSLQIVCVDDGSTDGSTEILAQAATADPRVLVITQTNAGLSAARNAGLAAASGRYVCFLDSDDHWLADVAAELVARADEAELDALLFDAVSFREPGVDDKAWESLANYYTRSRAHDEVVPGPELIASLKANKEYRASACLYLARRDWLLGLGLQFHPGIAHEDNVFTFALLLNARRASHTKTAVYGRRVRAGSIMTTSAREASARGYFISTYQMLRLVAGRSYPDAVATQLGAVIYAMFQQAKTNFVRLHPDVGDRFAEIDPGPDAQVLFRLLKRAYWDHRNSKRPSGKGEGASAPAAPGLARRVRSVLGRMKRSFLGVVRR